MTERPGPHLYLDPLLPVAIHPNPRTWPATPHPDTTSYIVVAWEGTVAGPAPSGAAVGSPALAWARPTDLHRLSGVAGWLLAIGHRVLQDISVGFFGEPGVCTFLDELIRPGWSPLGTSERTAIDAIASSLADEIHERPPAYRARVRGLLADLLLLVYRATLAGDATVNDGAYRLSDVVDFIETNFAEQLSLPDLADVLGCSPAYFSRLFSREIGVPPFEYINRVRVRHACVLLRSTERSITEIAFEVGYNNVSFFNRYFRRIMQRTPREYRRYVQG
jgi:AraC-like DNA-binding protein